MGTEGDGNGFNGCNGCFAESRNEEESRKKGLGEEGNAGLEGSKRGGKAKSCEADDEGEW